MPVNTILLDEPLSNLDAKLRVDMRSELKRLHEEMGTTIIYVTHDQVEALTLSTRIAVFFNGHIEQVASPMSLYQNPASVRIAEFIGNPKINLTGGKAKRTEAGLEVESAFGNFTFQKNDCTDKIPDGTFDCRIGFRPEEVTVSRTASKGAVECRVYSSMPAGSETLIRLSLAGEAFLAKRLGIRHYKADETVYAAIAPEKINVFDASSGVLVKKSAEGESD